MIPQARLHSTAPLSITHIATPGFRYTEPADKGKDHDQSKEDFGDKINEDLTADVDLVGWITNYCLMG